MQNPLTRKMMNVFLTRTQVLPLLPSQGYVEIIPEPG